MRDEEQTGAGGTDTRSVLEALAAGEVGIAVPVSAGYGAGGAGAAALHGPVRPCPVLTAVNVDAGLVAGAWAGLVARAIDGGD